MWPVLADADGPDSADRAGRRVRRGIPLATPGERMTYRVALRGMELATMQIAVGDFTDVGGKQTVVVQVHAKSVGLAQMVAAIDDTFTSWMTSRPAARSGSP